MYFQSLIPELLKPILKVLEEVERMWPLLELQVGPGQVEVLHLHSCPWNVHFAHCSCRRSHFQGHSLERIRCWDHLDWICDWAQIRYLYKLKILVGRWGDLLILQPPKTSLCTSSLLISLPPSSLEYWASFFCLSLLSFSGVQFQISPGKLLRFQTNRRILKTWLSLHLSIQNCDLDWLGTQKNFLGLS